MKVLWIIPAVLLLAACDVSRYTPATGENDQLYVIDKWTGEVSKVDNDQLISITHIGDTKVQTGLEAIEFESTTPSMGKVDVTPTIKFRDGKLLYKVKISKPVDFQDKTESTWADHIDKTRSNPSNKIIINLRDIDDFSIATINISFSDFIPIASTEEITEYIAQGEQTIGESEYRAIDNWVLGWTRI